MQRKLNIAQYSDRIENTGKIWRAKKRTHSPTNRWADEEVDDDDDDDYDCQIDSVNRNRQRILVDLRLYLTTCNVQDKAFNLDAVWYTIATSFPRDFRPAIRSIVSVIFNADAERINERANEKMIIYLHFPY